MSTVPPPQSSTITTFPFPNCSFTVCYASYLHWIEAPYGSRQSKRFWLLMLYVIPAWKAAFLIKSLCYSLQRAGTVRTQRILDEDILPTCYFSLFRACSLMKRKVLSITFKRGISLPSRDWAVVCICKRCILYWIDPQIHIGRARQFLRPRLSKRIFE